MEEAIIAAVFTTDSGIGSHLVNPENGTVTPGFGLEHVEFLPETVTGLQTVYKMQQATIKQLVEMLGDE